MENSKEKSLVACIVKEPIVVSSHVSLRDEMQCYLIQKTKERPKQTVDRRHCFGTVVILADLGVR